MPLAQGSRSGLSYIEEVTFGVTPVGDLTPLPFTTHSLNLTKARVEGSDIHPDRMPRHDRHGNRNAAGDLVVDLRDAVYDKLLESAMFSAFDASPDPTMSTGITPKSFTIEDAATDISQYRLFTGCTVSSMAISVAPNQMVKTTFSVVGKNMTIGQTPKTLTALTDADPFDSYTGTIKIGDAGAAPTTSGVVASMELSLDNGLNPIFVVGDDTTPALEYGRAVVTGTLVVYFEDETVVERFLDEIETSLQLDVSDPSGTVTYSFLMRRVKLNSADAPVDNPQSRLVTCEFVALRDPTANTVLEVTRILP